MNPAMVRGKMTGYDPQRPVYVWIDNPCMNDEEDSSCIRAEVPYAQAKEFATANRCSLEQAAHAIAEKKYFGRGS